MNVEPIHIGDKLFYIIYKNGYSTLSFLGARFNKEKKEVKTRVAILRQPFERFISAYLQINKNRITDENYKKTIDEFIINKENEMKDPHYNTQINFLLGKDIDEYIKLDDLSPYLRDTLPQLQIDIIRNRSCIGENNPDLKSKIIKYFTDNYKNIIDKIYEDDYELWNREIVNK